MKKAKKSKSKTPKQEAEFFRNFTETQRLKTQIENQKGPDILPFRPTEGKIRIAARRIQRLLRQGYFKKDKQDLLNAFNKGGELLLWVEMIKNLRARKCLPYPIDYLESFAEDLQFIADAIEERKEQNTGAKTTPKQPTEKWNAEDRLITALLKAQFQTGYVSLPELCFRAQCSRTWASKKNCPKFWSLFETYRTQNKSPAHRRKKG